MLAAGEAKLEKDLCRQYSNSHRMGKETPDSQCRHEEGLSDKKFHMSHRKAKRLDFCYLSPSLVHSKKLPELFTFRVTNEEFSDYCRNLRIDGTVTRRAPATGTSGRNVCNFYWRDMGTCLFYSR